MTTKAKESDLNLYGAALLNAVKNFKGPEKKIWNDPELMHVEFVENISAQEINKLAELIYYGSREWHAKAQTNTYNERTLLKDLKDCLHLIRTSGLITKISKKVGLEAELILKLGNTDSLPISIKFESGDVNLESNLIPVTDLIKKINLLDQDKRSKSSPKKNNFISKKSHRISCFISLLLLGGAVRYKEGPLCRKAILARLLTNFVDEVTKKSPLSKPAWLTHKTDVNIENAIKTNVDRCLDTDPMEVIEYCEEFIRSTGFSKAYLFLEGHRIFEERCYGFFGYDQVRRGKMPKTSARDYDRFLRAWTDKAHSEFLEYNRRNSYFETWLLSDLLLYFGACKGFEKKVNQAGLFTKDELKRIRAELKYWKKGIHFL